MKTLNERPKEVAKLVALGNTNKQIASAMFISIKTVEKHRMTANHFFNVDSAVGIARAMIRAGLLTIDEFVTSNVGDNMRHVPGAEREANRHTSVVGMKFFNA